MARCDVTRQKKERPRNLATLFALYGAALAVEADAGLAVELFQPSSFAFSSGLNG
jgi:hypothetical protein